MKRWIAVLAVCVAMVLVGGGIAPPCWGDSLISFTHTASSPTEGLGFGNITDNQLLYASWTQTVASTNTSISAVLTALYADVGPGTVWLTNALGP
jgi:hypothetical protein